LEVVQFISTALKGIKKLVKLENMDVQSRQILYTFVLRA
jgi:hypothetical protein